MTNIGKWSLVTVAIVVTTLMGCATGSDAGAPAPSADLSASEPPSSASPELLGSDDSDLEAGTYVLDLDALRPSAEKFPRIMLTLPDGWANFGGWVIHKGQIDSANVAVQFWDVVGVYEHPCEGSGEVFEPGPTVDDLALALSNQPLRNASTPADVIVDGYAGKQMDLSVPADIRFEDCHEGFFDSWTATGWSSGRYQQGPGQIDQLWILDVDGARLVIDAFFMPDTSEQDRAELMQVVESIRFER